MIRILLLWVVSWQVLGSPLRTHETYDFYADGPGCGIRLVNEGGDELQLKSVSLVRSPDGRPVTHDGFFLPDVLLPEGVLSVSVDSHGIIILDSLASDMKVSTVGSDDCRVRQGVLEGRDYMRLPVEQIQRLGPGSFEVRTIPLAVACERMFLRWEIASLDDKKIRLKLFGHHCQPSAELIPLKFQSSDFLSGLPRGQWEVRGQSTASLSVLVE